jgi:hypothetical protein
MKAKIFKWTPATWGSYQIAKNKTLQGQDLVIRTLHAQNSKKGEQKVLRRISRVQPHHLELRWTRSTHPQSGSLGEQHQVTADAAERV